MSGATLACASITGTHSCWVVMARIAPGWPAEAAAICAVASVAVSGSDVVTPNFAPLAAATEATISLKIGAAAMSRLIRLTVLALPLVVMYFVQSALSETRLIPMEKASGDVTSSGVTAAGPTSGMPAPAMIGTLPAVPSSDSPTKASGWSANS